MEKNEKEVIILKGRFDAFEKHFNSRLDEIMDSLKPKYSDKQIMGFILFLLTSLVSIMIYVEGIKSDTRVNTLEIDHTKDLQRIELKKFDQILETLSQIKTDVAVLKDDNEESIN